MMDSTDMSTPVTRGELQEVLSQVKQEHRRDLREAIAPLATRAELQAAIAPLATRAELQAAIAPLATKAELQAAIAPLATKAELEMWGGALLERIKHGEVRFTESLQQTEQRFSDRLQQIEQRLLAELARHTSAVHEAMRTEIKASFEPLADLRGRMSRLKAAVSGPKPDRPTRRRKH